MRRTAYLGCSLVLTAALAIPLFAQTAAAQDDGTAYANFYAESNQQKKAELGEKFVTDYKTSQYADPVFRQTVSLYYKLKNWPKVNELANKTDQLFPSMEASNKAQVYALAMDGAQQSNNAAQTITFGEKILAIAPNDANALNTLITLSSTIPVAMPKDKAAIEKAEGYANKALGMLSKLDPKSLGISEADWAKQKLTIEGTLHNTLGNIHVNQQNYDKAVEELVQATKALPRDGTSWYLLGLAYNQQYATHAKNYAEAVAKSNEAIRARADQALIDESKATVVALEQVARDKRDQAIEALATAVSCGGTTQQPALDQLKKLYSTKNNGSLDGLDQLIKSKQPAQ